MIQTQGWLPIGSVVHLRGREGMLVLMSAMVADSQGGQLWDYAALPYPTGRADGEKSVLFDRDAIDCVYFVGLQDADGLRLQDMLEAQADAFEERKAERRAGAAAGVAEDVAR